jgi:hypothetical protein
MSASLPKATEVLRCRENEAAPLFDHLVGAGEQRWRYVKAEALSGFQIDH